MFLRRNQLKTNRSGVTGIILPVVLIVLAVMTLSGVALLRSTDSSLLIAGNFAFQRDLVNQAERVIPVVRALFQSGALEVEADRESSEAQLNYYSFIQPANERDIPTALLNIAADNGANIIENGVVIRYVIERMCFATGPSSNENCLYIDSIIAKTGGNALNNINLGTKQYPSYRVSVWVSGPRSGETFVQTIITI